MSQKVTILLSNEMVQPKCNVALGQLCTTKLTKSGHGTHFNCESSSLQSGDEDLPFKQVPCHLFIEFFAMSNCVSVMLRLGSTVLTSAVGMKQPKPTIVFLQRSCENA